MTVARQLAEGVATDVATMTIRVDGESLSAKLQVIAVSIQKAANRIPWATLTLVDGDPALGDFPASSGELLVPGKELEVLAGYHSDEETVFKGLIVGQGIRARQNQGPVLIVKCRDAAVKLCSHRKSAYYLEMKDSEIADQLLADQNLTASVEATSVTFPNMVRTASTDWDFILSRAEANGHLVLVSDGKVTIGPPDPDNQAELGLVYGATLIDFEAEVDARHQVVAAASSSWDPATQELLEENADAPSFIEQGDLSPDDLSTAVFNAEEMQTHTGARSDSELKAWADARLLKSRMAKIVGRAKCQGFAAILPGQVIQLEGVGSRYDGDAFVSAVRQELSPTGWLTHIQFGMEPSWFQERQPGLSPPPAAGLLPAVPGLQIAVVTQVGEDPDGEDRVRVCMPAVDPTDDGTWARVASADAGDQRGAFFRPEIGDEVVLGFLNSDPRDPILLGMLNSSAKPAPLTASDDNHEKGFITRSGMKLLFNDDEPTMTLETPAGNKLVFSDSDEQVCVEDQHGNKLELSSSGILLESTGTLDLTAAGDITIDGANIQLKTDGELKGDGAAGAELVSSGTTVVKGSLVQIN